MSGAQAIAYWRGAIVGDAARWRQGIKIQLSLAIVASVGPWKLAESSC